MYGYQAIGKAQGGDGYGNKGIGEEDKWKLVIIKNSAYCTVGFFCPYRFFAILYCL
jgi:hypothetical protein